MARHAVINLTAQNRLRTLDCGCLTGYKPAFLSITAAFGEVAEWLKAPHSKCGILARVSGVRIPPSPPRNKLISIHKTRFRNFVRSVRGFAQDCRPVSDRETASVAVLACSAGPSLLSGFERYRWRRTRRGIRSMLPETTNRRRGRRVTGHFIGSGAVNRIQARGAGPTSGVRTGQRA